MPSGPDPNPGDLPAAGSRGDVLTRRFGWSDMFVRPEDDPRTDGGFHDERTTLTGYLRDYRLTIELKCSGLDAAWAAWRAEVAFAEELAGQAPDLEVSGTYGQGQTISLREVLVHMIEEYARHAGHADLLRERIDGRVGQ